MHLGDQADGALVLVDGEGLGAVASRAVAWGLDGVGDAAVSAFVAVLGLYLFCGGEGGL